MSYTFALDKLDSFYRSNRIPHIIFHGSSLSKKEDIMMGFLKKIYEKENDMSENVMFVNCAHGKGIRFIRDEIKFFAKTNSKPTILFKSVVLLNGDHLTMDAQSALRRCIEQFSHHTRFFVVAENKNKLLSPILSRFCEIYIPDVQVSVTPNTRIIEIHKYLESYTTKEKTKQEMVKTVQTLYNNGFCCMDIINWIQSRSEWEILEKANIGMCFSKLKLEYRSEKLIMLIMLYIACNCPHIDLKKMSFM